MVWGTRCRSSWSAGGRLRAAVPQLSGRGLGHTRGTLDKLEAIPGWRAALSADEMLSVLRRTGAVICAAGPGLAPADAKLYALRDVTGTVEAIPLIASSIMAKKIAEGTESLVLDVKVGSGAFLPSVAMARELAETMVGLGQAHGVRTVALLTDMEAPLGSACGNGLEVTESIEVLQGGGPADVRELTLALAREMLALAGVDNDPAGRLDDGTALASFDALIRAQGGDPEAPLEQAEHVRVVPSPAAGFVRRLDARAVGVAAWRLGAAEPAGGSRERRGRIVCRAKPGDSMVEGQPLLELHAEDEERFDGAVAALADAIEIGPEPPDPRPLVIDRIA
ncbi:MAG: thymidine phosphorylase [Acidimicrobiales bacterium]